MDDFELLKSYAEHGSEEAFRTLTTRYVNLVYSAARRQVRDAHLAEEITQAVFLVLSKKAASIRRDVLLSAWLLQTTRYIAANALRREMRRQHYEQEAMATLHHSSESETAWEQLAPLLDEALVGLGSEDRAAIVLRFFEKKSFREVGDSLRTTEDTAQKRVSRALVKLRAFFERRGVAVSVITLSTTLANNAVQSAPAPLTSSILSIVVKGAGVTGSVATLARQALSPAVLDIRSKVAALAAVIIASMLLLMPKFTASRPNASSESLKETAQRRESLPGKPVRRAIASSSNAEHSVFAFRVVDSVDAKPVASAILTLVEISNFPERTTNIFQTDATGLALLPRPRLEVPHWNYQIEVFRDGYVPEYVSWGETQGDAFDSFPSEYTAQVDRGTVIGGLVQNEKAEPISGVKVIFNVSGPAPGATHERERLTMMRNYHHEITDEQGRWRCDHVPKNFGIITWRLIHPDYKATSYESDAPESPMHGGVRLIAAADLLAGTAVMTMRTGSLITGIVVDHAGKPLSGAKVTVDRDYGPRGLSLWTAANGTFRFTRDETNDVLLTIQKAGYAPTNDTVQSQTDASPRTYVLRTGQTLRGQVVNETGEPITNAVIRSGADRFSRLIYPWQTLVDQNGSFYWADAPTGKFSIVATAPGYKLRTITAEADANELTVTLDKASASAKKAEQLRVACLVVDADTKNSIEKFNVSVSEMRKEKNRIMTIGMQPVGPGIGGTCNFIVSSAAFAFITEVTADGYFPARLTNSTTATGELELKVELKKGRPIEGIVQFSDGQPAAGAQVFVCAGHNLPRLQVPRRFQTTTSARDSYTETDTAGKFSLPLKYEARAIVAAHESGFGEIMLDELAATGVVTLMPWGRIEGTFRIGRQLMTNETVGVNKWLSRYGTSGNVYVLMEVQTDDSGNFVMEGLPPGEYRVDYRPSYRKGRTGPIPQSHGVPVVVRAGETTHVSLGGEGRRIVGRVDATGISHEIDWLQDVHELELEIPEIPVAPTRDNFSSPEEYAEALKAFRKIDREFAQSEQGKTAIRSQRSYVLIFNPDGSFYADGVPPGTYRLAVLPLKKPPITNPNAFFTEPVGSVHLTFTVPDDGKDEPIDLGTLQLSPR